jgi:hypothetical protein
MQLMEDMRSRLTTLLFCAALFVLCGPVEAQVTLPAGVVITASNTTYDNLDIVVDGSVTGTATIDGKHSFKSLTVQNGGVVTHDSQSSANFAGGMNLTIAGNCTITVGSSINATGRGWAGGASGQRAHGSGAGKSDTSGSWPGGGGAYGGEALYTPVASGGAVYDDLTLKTPTDLGSGGGSGYAGSYAGGAGGGAVQLSVGGTLQVDGALVADGANGNDSGAGSGGSLYLTVGTLSGSGYISASGGTGNNGGAGSGGRIAIYYTTNSFATPLSASGYAIRAAGGNGYVGNYYGWTYAGAGTVFLQQSGQTQGDLWVHNQGGSESAYTPLQDALTFDDVYIWGQGVLASQPGKPLTLQVLGTLDIAVDGALSVSGRGYAGASGGRQAGGPGAGHSDVSDYPGGGGGYGGAGDADNYNVNHGGGTYGSATLPTDLGSGGGSGYYGGYGGGAGGGAIHAIVNGTLQVDGQLRADGAGSGNGRGGSGGSLWLVTNTLSGAGIISASGGNTGNNGGGGGGGRIVVYAFANNFSTGTVQANGGSDNHSSGAAGTVNVIATSGVSVSALTLVSSTLPEGQGTTGSVTLSGPAPAGGVTIALIASNSTVATIPPSVTISAGQKGATFPITANSSGTAGSVAITASLGGVVQTATLNVLPWIAGVTLNPPAVPGGVTSTGTVTLNFTAPQNGLPVNLSSANTSAANVPTSVTVAQGATSATFTVTTSGSVTTETPVAIGAAYNSVETFSSTLYVDPAKAALKAFTLSPASVVGGNVSVGTVSLTGKAPTGGVVVALSSANPGLLSLPAYVTVPAGLSHIAFLIPTPQVTASQSVSLSAALGSVTKSATLQIQPTGVASVTLVPNSLQGGVETAAGIVTLQSAVSTSTTVKITSSSALAVPDATVVIPAGSLVGIFTINTNTNTTGKAVNATITATANNISAKATLTIN